MILALLLGAPQGGVLAGTRTGVITGQVRMPGGTPVSGIRVAAMEAPEMGNQDSAVSVMAGLTTTDATGRYRLEDIPVGKYFVVAGSLDNLSYYPGSITVTSVAPAENVDFSLSDSYDGIIEVNVHLVGSPMPVPGREVRIRSTSSTFARSLDTNEKGVVSFAGIPYGDYAVTTSVISMADALAGGNAYGNARDLSVTITINPDRPKWAVSLGLLLPGVVRGVVRNVDGTPAVDVVVNSMKVGYRDGRRTPIPESSARTGSSGGYELPASPGDHFIRVTAIIEDSPALPGAAVAFNETYYPAAGNPGDAKLVRLANGEEVVGIDVAMVRSYSVSGRISNIAPDSTPPSFVLVSRSGLDAVIPSVRFSPDANSGAFEIHGVPAGAWDLFAVFGSGIPELHQTGKVELDVRDRDIDGLMIALQAAELHGKITGLGSESATVRLVPIDSIDGALTDAVPGLVFPSSDGNFAFSNVPALRYRVEVNGLLPGWYVADIRMGAASIFNDNVISVDSAPLLPIEVRVSSGAGKIRGTVGTLQAGARVVLVPDEPRRNNVLLYRTSPIQSDGTFSIVPDPGPGSYKLFAVSNLPAGHAEWNAEFVAKYADVAIPVTVMPNQSIQTKLVLTPAR